MTDTIATTAGCSRVSHSPSRSLSLPLGSSILLSLSPYSPFSINVSLFIVWSLSLCPTKTVSQQQSSEIPRTRYEFTFLLLYSTLACPPFCLLESLVCLADLRLPYVSAARLSHRLLFSPFFPSLSRSRPIFSRYIRVWSCCSDVVVVVFVVFSVVFVAAAIVVSSSSSSLGRRRVFVLLRTIDAYIPTTSKYVHACTYTMVCKRTYTRMTYWNIYVLVQNVVNCGRQEKDTGNRTVQCLPYM